VTHTLVVRFSPRAIKAREHEVLRDALIAGTSARCPGKWRVLEANERERIGMIRVFQFELEPLDAVARETIHDDLF
jgi:hypothetical protein